MADISMCINESCPLKLSCYRYLAQPDDIMQSYAKFEWEKDENGVISCPVFWKFNIEKHDTTRKTTN